MAILELALLLLAAVLVSSVIDQLVPKVSSPLIQIALGVLIALGASSSIDIELDPELFLVLFIAPLLFDAAKNANKVDLWRNRGAVVSLAVGLVVVSTLVIGFSVNALIPSIPLAAAFALGAALGPTDAVSVASLSNEVDLPERQKALLKGESLINDASGIVSFQFAIAAVVTGSFSLIDASADFAVSFFGGLILGLVLGFAGNAAIRAVRAIGLENTTFHVLFEVFTPFIVFLIAEPTGASGIIAVVAAGLVNVVSPRLMGPSVSRMNIVSSSVWKVLEFTLNGIVFVLLGTQLPKAMVHAWSDYSISNPMLVAYVLAITALLMAIRFVWCVGLEWVHVHRKKPRRKATKDDLRAALITTLAGSKGTITLSIMFTVPVFIGSAQNPVRFPHRDLLIFLASGVIVCTLLLATFVVPLITPKKKEEKEEQKRREAECLIGILRLVIESITARQTPETRAATRAVVHSYNERISRIKGNNDIEEDSDILLRLQALKWEMECVDALVEAGEIKPVAGYRYIRRVLRRRRFITHAPDRSSIHSGLSRMRSLMHSGVRAMVHEEMSNTAAQRIEASRALQLRACEYVVERLGEVISQSDDVPTEEASRLLVEYQRACASLRSSMPSVTALARVSDKAQDILRYGLQLELEQIQTKYEEGCLSRATANRLRENVYLMQIDLEDTV